jgi:hypothetical protein
MVLTNLRAGFTLGSGDKISEAFKLRIWRVLKRTVSVFTGVFFKKKSHPSFSR